MRLAKLLSVALVVVAIIELLGVFSPRLSLVLSLITTLALGGVDLSLLLGLNLTLDVSFVVILRARSLALALNIDISLQPTFRLDLDSRVLLDDLTVFIVEAIIYLSLFLTSLALFVVGFLRIASDSLVCIQPIWRQLFALYFLVQI